MPTTAWQELSQTPEEWDKLNYDDPRLDEFAGEVEKHYGLPQGVILALKNAGERTPSKASGRPTVSSAGARGIMQFTAPAIKDFPHDPNDPFQSIDAAGRYMRDRLKKYSGDVWAAIADYNGGYTQGNPVLHGQKPPAAETQAYLKRIYNYMNKRGVNSGG